MSKQRGLAFSLIAAAFEIAPPTMLASSSEPAWSFERGQGHRAEAA